MRRLSSLQVHCGTNGVQCESECYDRNTFYILFSVYPLFASLNINIKVVSLIIYL